MTGPHTPAPASRAPQRQADAIVRWLVGQRVERIYALSGNQIMPLFDACIDSGLEIVHVRHEAAAVYMADAAAQLAGRPAVALVTAGPGFGNALGALYAARCAQSPLILLSGDADDGPAGLGAFQRLDQCSAAAPFVKASLRAHDALTPARALARAWRIACTAPAGPVHVALPASSLLQAGVDDELPSALADSNGRDAVQAAVALRERLAGVVRPLVVVGPALARHLRGAGLARLSEALSAPVHAALSPRGLRDPSAGALSVVAREADLIVLLGQDVDFSVGRLQGLRADAFCIHADEAALAQAGTLLAPRQPMLWCADPAAVVDRLLSEAPAGAGERADDNERWVDWARRAVAHRELAAPAPAFVAGLQVAARWLGQRSDPTLIIDGGEFGQWVQAFLSASTRLINGPSGAIGGGLPMAVAASLERPASDVVLFSGDGSIGFHLAEFETALRAGGRPIVIVGNDCAWNAERQIQLRDYGPRRQIGCELSGEVRYDELVQALGGFGRRVESAEALELALDEAQAARLPACIDWRIDGRPAPDYLPFDAFV
ncbi:MAG: thiamine pyrophosphate-binding protein [Burkholderiaceae bacterium]